MNNRKRCIKQTPWLLKHSQHIVVVFPLVNTQYIKIKIKHRIKICYGVLYFLDGYILSQNDVLKDLILELKYCTVSFSLQHAKYKKIPRTLGAICIGEQTSPS